MNAPAATLAYDAQGRLSEIVKGVDTTRMLYDGVNLIAEYDGSGNVLRRFVHGPGTDEPMVWYEGSGSSAGVRRWFLANQQGSIISIADNTGASIATSYCITKSDACSWLDSCPMKIT